MKDIRQTVYSASLPPPPLPYFNITGYMTPPHCLPLLPSSPAILHMWLPGVSLALFTVTFRKRF